MCQSSCHAADDGVTLKPDVASDKAARRGDEPKSCRLLEVLKQEFDGMVSQLLVRNALVPSNIVLLLHQCGLASMTRLTQHAVSNSDAQAAQG